MDAYTGFAQIYDELMDNVPYEDWHRFICTILKENDIDDGLILDLGCGTGTLTEMLASSGYDMIGVDSAEDMLSIAMEKRDKSGHDILYLLQDMRRFELYGTVRAIVSVCDSMNYLTDPKDFKEVLYLAANYLDDGGIFFFDLNTVYKYEKILADATFAENRENCSFIWENDYDVAGKINEYALTVYVRDEEASDQPTAHAQETYRRYEEIHEQRAYSIGEVQALIDPSVFQLLAIYDDYTKEPPTEESGRICLVLKRKGR